MVVHWQRRAILFALLIGLLTLFGCASKPAIEGSWSISSQSSGSGMSESSETVFAFKHDGAVEESTHTNFGQLAMDDTSTGTYTINGNHLIVAITSRTTGLDPATQKAMIARLRTINPNAPSPSVQAPKTIPTHQSPSTYTFSLSNDNNTLSLTPASGAQAMELHREGSAGSPAATSQQ